MSSEQQIKMKNCETCNGKGMNSRGCRCLDCKGTGKVPDDFDENMVECVECGNSIADCTCNIEDELRESEDIPELFD